MKMQRTVQGYDQSDCRAQCEPPAIEQKLLTQLGEHFFFLFFFFHMKPKHCILASETCEMWVQLTVQSCTFTALGAHQASSAPRVLAVLSLDPTVGLPVALPPEEQGLMPALQQSPVLSGLFFFHGGNRSTRAPAEHGTRNTSPPQIWV